MIKQMYHISCLHYLISECMYFKSNTHPHIHKPNKVAPSSQTLEMKHQQLNN